MTWLDGVCPPGWPSKPLPRVGSGLRPPRLSPCNTRGGVGGRSTSTHPARSRPSAGGNSRGKRHEGRLGRDTTEVKPAEGRDGSPPGSDRVLRTDGHTHTQTHIPAEARGVQHQFQPRDRPGADADTSCPHSVGWGALDPRKLLGNDFALSFLRFPLGESREHLHS